MAPDLPYGYSHDLRRLVGDSPPMTEEETAANPALLAEYRPLEEEYPGQGEYAEEIDARIGQPHLAMEVFDARPLILDPAEVARAGGFVTLDWDGGLAVYRGYVRPEDEPREESTVQYVGHANALGQGADANASAWQPTADSPCQTVITSGGQPIGPGLSDDEDDGALKPQHKRSLMELTARCALLEAIGRSPRRGTDVPAPEAGDLSACIPGRKSRKKTVKYDKRRYKRRNRIEIMFGRLKDWRRVATRYDRCPETYLSAIALAATVLFWL